MLMKMMIDKSQAKSLSWWGSYITFYGTSIVIQFLHALDIYSYIKYFNETIWDMFIVTPAEQSINFLIYLTDFLTFLIKSFKVKNTNYRVVLFMSVISK